METEEYKLMFESESTHWWYKGLHHLILSTIQRIIGERKNIAILDAGCGTGYMLKLLEKYGITFGIDISDIALEYCARMNLKRVTKASVTQIPFSDNTFDLVVSTDVLYHKCVEDDVKALCEIYRVLKKGAFLLLNLPAHNYLRRFHDNRVHTRHRYEKSELLRKLKDNRFKIIKISYRNSILFPIVLMSKLFKKNRNKSSDLRPIFGPVNFVLYSISKIENSLLTKVNIPFGTSIFCIAQK